MAEEINKGTRGDQCEAERERADGPDLLGAISENGGHDQREGSNSKRHGSGQSSWNAVRPRQSGLTDAQGHQHPELEQAIVPG